MPETIISRTQRFSFKPVVSSEAIEHLGTIAKQEGIEISREALELIAEHGGGSFRDSISLLDQLNSKSQKISLADVQAMLGIAPATAIARLFDLIDTGATEGLVNQLTELRAQGYQSPQLAHQLSQTIRKQLIDSNQRPHNHHLTGLLAKLLEVQASHNPDALLELVLLEHSLLSASPEAETVTRTEKTPAKKNENTNKDAQTVSPVKREQEKTSDPLDNDVWQQALQAIKRQHNTLYGIARMAVPEFKDNELTLRFAFPFHQKRFNEDKNRSLISEIIKKQTGQAVFIVCLVDKSLSAAQQPEAKPLEKPDDPLDNISNIFGSAEVLES